MYCAHYNFLKQKWDSQSHSTYVQYTHLSKANHENGENRSHILNKTPYLLHSRMASDQLMDEQGERTRRLDIASFTHSETGGACMLHK